MLLTCPGCTSGVRRWFTLATGLIECLCFTGVLFGWASLVFVLKTEGYFSSLCVNTTVNGTQTVDCGEQDERFSLVFTIAVFVDNFLTLPNGFLFDRYGTAVARLIAISLYTMGTLFFAFSSSAHSKMLFPALSFIALGGTLLLITNMQVGNLFGSHRSTIITLYNGAFDSSSVVFLIIKLLVESGVSLRHCFLFMSGCGVIHVARTFLLMPTSSIPYPLPDSYTYGVTCGKSIHGDLEPARGQIGLQGDNATAGTPVDQQSPPKKEVSPAPERSFRECVLSRFFLWHLLWLSVMQLRHFLFIGTLNPTLQREAMGDPLLVSQYLDAFALTQLFGLLCSPWNGLIIDRHKGKPRAAGESEREADLRASVLSLSLTSLQCVLFSVCATIPILPLQYLTFILQVLNRSFLYGGNAAFISIAFPSCHFGKLFGLVMALASVVSLLQFPCFLLVKGALGGDPLYVNATLILLSLVTFIHPLSVYLHCRNTTTKRLALTIDQFI